MHIRKCILAVFGNLRDRLWPLNGLQWFGLLILSLGILATVLGHWELHNARRSVHWPEARGIVIKSHLKKYYADDDSTEPSYNPIIEYTYQVNGKHYTSDRRHYESIALDKKNAEALINRYPLDFPVTVYYSPEYPGVSVLERGVFASNYGKVITGYAIFALGLIMFIVTTIRYND